MCIRDRCEAVLAEHEKVEKITLLLKKPEAPMNAIFEYVAVEVLSLIHI